MNSGKTLKLIRAIRGLTQKQLANLLHVSQQAVSKMENHTWIDRRYMQKILETVKCSAEELADIKRIISKMD
jgi:transcriptional regulator with XRE-family HTH domain